MPLPFNSTLSAESLLAATELRMREALGLRGNPVSEHPSCAQSRHGNGTASFRTAKFPWSS